MLNYMETTVNLEVESLLMEWVILQAALLITIHSLKIGILFILLKILHRTYGGNLRSQTSKDTSCELLPLELTCTLKVEAQTKTKELFLAMLTQSLQ